MLCEDEKMSEILISSIHANFTNNIDKTNNNSEENIHLSSVQSFQDQVKDLMGSILRDLNDRFLLYLL